MSFWKGSTESQVVYRLANETERPSYLSIRILVGVEAFTLLLADAGFRL